MSQIVWRSFSCSIQELKIETTLACGQSFRWKKQSNDEWIGVIRDQVWKLKQTPTDIFYQVFKRNSSETIRVKDLSCIKTETSEEFPQIKKRKIKEKPKVKEETESSQLHNDEEILKDYFQLNVKLDKLYKKWADVDSNFQDISANFPGIRILRQDPVENLFSFICSSNNHISRISSMVEKLCVHFGKEIMVVDGQRYFQFPSVSSLAGNKVEQQLRDLGFGYRAKYIYQTAKYIVDNHNEEWLYSLKLLPYKDVKIELMKLCGVGAKVADCVCLMSMDQMGAIPVDTHVWQIAARHYLPKLQQSKSLTDKLYNEIGDHFRDLWGEYAGWAHSVLFTADLKKFQDKKDIKKNDSSKKIKKERK